MGPPDAGGYLARTIRHLRRAGVRMRSMRAHSEACAREIAAEGFDVLYAHNDRLYNAPFVGRAACGGIPKLLYLQEPQRALYEAYPEFVWAAPPEKERISLPRRLREAHDLSVRRVQAREEALNAKAFDRVLVNSCFSRESALKAYGREGLDVRVCHLGVDLDRFVNRRRVRERFVLGLGAVAAPKNVEGAIRAVAAIDRDRPPLIWVGNVAEEPYRARMVELATRLEVDLSLRILVSDAELHDLLDRAGAMVYAPFLEPFGYAPLEANACGLAVAAVAEGGLRETVTDGANGIVAAPEPAALGRAIEAILDDPSLGERAERHVRANWGGDRMVDEVERHLVEVSGKA